MEYNKDLKAYNTFGVSVRAARFLSINSEQALIDFLQQHDGGPLFILGGGSNMLLTQDIDATVLHIDIQGTEVVAETDSTVHLKVMAGVSWHKFVLDTLERDLGGVENLSLIPGNVGTAPIQNIGAYGAELKDVLLSCDAIAIKDGTKRAFKLEDCGFGYRDSVFKQQLKGQYIITAVTFVLAKQPHTTNTNYGDVQQYLTDNALVSSRIKDVSQAIIAIRQSKLPDPAVLGNSGSFFKNPVISAEEFARLRESFPDMRHYPLGDGSVKIPAGYLIDQAGLKGKRWGDAGVHDRQALVLVNHGNATGQEILKVARKVQQAVLDKYGIALEMEVNVF